MDQLWNTNIRKISRFFPRISICEINPNPHRLILSWKQGMHHLESGALDHSAILTCYIVRSRIWTHALIWRPEFSKAFCLKARSTIFTMILPSAFIMTCNINFTGKFKEVFSEWKLSWFGTNMGFLYHTHIHLFDTNTHN